MKTIKVLREFRYAEPGEEVETFEPGSEANVSDACAQTAVEERWAEYA